MLCDPPSTAAVRQCVSALTLPAIAMAIGGVDEDQDAMKLWFGTLPGIAMAWLAASSPVLPVLIILGRTGCPGPLIRGKSCYSID